MEEPNKLFWKIVFIATISCFLSSTMLYSHTGFLIFSLSVAVILISLFYKIIRRF